MKNIINNCRQISCPLVSRTEIGGDLMLIRLETPEIAEICQPGQFVEVRASKGIDPLWRRPFSIHRAYDRGIEILYQIRGKGTQFMTDLKIGDKLDVIGPLGRGFQFSETCRRVVLVGGGCGIAPLTFVADEAKRRGLETCAVWGISSWQNYTVENEFNVLGVKIHVATEDGSFGKEGLVSGYFDEIFGTPDESLAVMACGPSPMLRAIHEHLKGTKASCQLSFESLMACGIGCCHGCVIKTLGDDGAEHFVRVCREGPVFEAQNVIWE